MPLPLSAPVCSAGWWVGSPAPASVFLLRSLGTSREVSGLLGYGRELSLPRASRKPRRDLEGRASRAAELYHHSPIPQPRLSVGLSVGGS